MQSIKDRVLNRLTHDELSHGDREHLIPELITTITDRLCLRLDTDSLPEVFESIVVEAVVKSYRRTFYEGIASESDGGGGFSTSFVEDILSEYSTEIQRYRENHIASSKRGIKFL